MAETIVCPPGLAAMFTSFIKDKPGSRMLLDGMAGCHAKDTLILMHDGSVKKVQQVCVGDQLMGPDSKPRTVLALRRGREEMRRITPIKGEAFVVNKSHILHLKKTRTGVKKICDESREHDMSVTDLEAQTKGFRQARKLIRVGVSFGEKNQPLPARFVGMMLGDGTLNGNSPYFCGSEDILLSYMAYTAKKYGCSPVAHTKKGTKAINLCLGIAGGGFHKSNPLTAIYRGLKLWHTNSYTVFIPEIYRTGSREQRLELLAGLIDTDGHYYRNCYEVTTVSRHMAEDIRFVALSLGFYASLSVGKASVNGRYISDKYRVIISGNTDQIPVLVEYKKASTRGQKKDVLCTGFAIENLPEDDYYGFTLTGDHLYLTGDFTVHHNCGKSSQTAQNLMPLFFAEYPRARVRYLAPTHAAKNELRDKVLLWSGILKYHANADDFMTTHAYTGMVPVTDDGAIQANLVRRIRQIGEALECDLLIVDEAPMIDPDVGAQLNYLLESGLVKRAMFMGDQNQLKPVNGAPVIVPTKNEKYHYLIKDTYRAAGEDIRNHVRELYRKIDTGNGDGLRYTIPATENVRYGNLPSTLRTNARVLAYTHKAVQSVNAQLRGRSHAEEGDITYSRTTKTHYRVMRITDADNYFFFENIRTLERVRQNPGEDPAIFDRLLNERSDRFRTRSHCSSLPGVQLMVLQPVVLTPAGWENEDEPETWFVLYGSSRHNQATKQAQKEGIRHNQELCEKYGVPDDELTDWCTERWDWDEVKAKKKAWRTFFALDRTIMCLDAPFCITVHQSQGMTIPRTYVALDDIKLAKVTDQGGDTFARLLYVALSRASREIVILQDDLY